MLREHREQFITIVEKNKRADLDAGKHATTASTLQQLADAATLWDRLKTGPWKRLKTWCAPCESTPLAVASLHPCHRYTHLSCALHMTLAVVLRSLAIFDPAWPDLLAACPFEP